MKSVGIGLAAAGVLLLALVILFLRTTFTPQPLLEQATPVATPTAGQLATPAANLPTLVNIRNCVTFTLSADWQVAELASSQLEQALGSAANTTAITATQAAIGSLRQATGPESMVLTASLPDESGAGQPATLVALAVARNGLSLERYLDDVQAQLTSVGVVVDQTGIYAQLRGDGLPVAVLEYTQPTEDQTLRKGYQIVTLDASAELLVILTFTAPIDRFALLLPKFIEIIQSADFA